MAETNRVLDTKLVRANPRRASMTRPADAIDLLKADHQRVERMFRRFAQARGREERAALGGKICDLLAVHMRIEEEIFYPAFMQATGDVEMHHEAEVEHDGVKILIAQIRQSSPDDAHYTAKIKVLGTLVRHHVQEEEKRDGMFAEARSAGMDLLALGEELKTRRDQLKRRMMPRSRTSAASQGVTSV
jgi:hemerythrin superfamily protein